MTHFHLFIPAGILPSIKIPKIKLQKKFFSFSIGKTRDSYNVTAPQPDNRTFVPTISQRVHESVDENTVQSNPDHVIGDKQKNQINSNFAASCINQNNLQNVLGASFTGGSSSSNAGGGSITLNIPLKANNNARRAPRDMNHEKFTPCQRRFQQHENSITDYNKNVKFCKGTGPKQGDQDRVYYEDRCCNENMVKIAPPPRQRKSKLRKNIPNRMTNIQGTMDGRQPVNQTLIGGDFNFMSSDEWDFDCMSTVKSCHNNPNNKSDPWTVSVDYRKLGRTPSLMVENTNVASVSHTFEDEFVNGKLNSRKVNEKQQRPSLKPYKRSESVNIFELGKAINVFHDFDELFDSNQSTTNKPAAPVSDQLKSKYDCKMNRMNGQPHAVVDVIVKPNNNKRTIEASNTKTVSFASSDAYAKMKKEQTNLTKYNGNSRPSNHGSENGFPTFECSGNQNIAVNHMLNQDIANGGMRNESSRAKRSVVCEWEMFEHCANVGNGNICAVKFSLDQFRNNMHQSNVLLDEQCLTIVLDLLDSELRTGNMNGK